MGTPELFQADSRLQSSSQRQAASSSIGDSITLASHRLAVRFTEDTQLPARYKRLSDPSRKISRAKKESEVEKRFKANVESWRQLIQTMLAKIDQAQAWRFINLCPQVADTMNHVTDNEDFCDFIDYIVQRRDKEQCDPDELGGLALLSVAFQREVEKRIPE